MSQVLGRREAHAGRKTSANGSTALVAAAAVAAAVLLVGGGHLKTQHIASYRCELHLRQQSYAVIRSYSYVLRIRSEHNKEVLVRKHSYCGANHSTAAVAARAAVVVRSKTKLRLIQQCSLACYVLERGDEYRTNDERVG